MAKKSKLDAYLASVRTAPRTSAPHPNTLANALLRDGVAPIAIPIPAMVPADVPMVATDAETREIAIADDTTTAAADALVGPPVDSPVSRAFAGALAGERTIDPGAYANDGKPRAYAVAADRTRTIRGVAGIGVVVIHLGTDGAPDYAASANGQTIARYRRRSPSEPARRWWPDASIASSRQIAGCVLTALEREHASEPAAPVVVAPAPVAAPSQPPAANATTVAPAKRERSTDPGVSAVLAIVARYGAAASREIAASELEREISDGMRGGSIEPIAAWSAAAWLEGRAVTLFGAQYDRAMAARDALRSAVATHLRASASEPARGVPVDLVMAAIGGAA